MRVHAVHDTENPPTLRCPCGAEAGLNVPLGVYDCRFPPPLAGGEGGDASGGPEPGDTDTCNKKRDEGRGPDVCVWGAGARVARTPRARPGPPPKTDMCQLNELGHFIRRSETCERADALTSVKFEMWPNTTS